MLTEEQEIRIKGQNKITALSTIPVDIEARKTSNKDKAIIMVNAESLISVAIGDIVIKRKRCSVLRQSDKVYIQAGHLKYGSN